MALQVGHITRRIELEKRIGMATPDADVDVVVPSPPTYTSVNITFEGGYAQMATARRICSAMALTMGGVTAFPSAW